MGLQVDTIAVQWHFTAVLFFATLDLNLTEFKIYMLLRCRKMLPSVPCHGKNKQTVVTLFGQFVTTQLA